MSDKLDELLGLVHEMKPMLSDVRESQKATESRVRASELLAVEHGVKITRLESDVDGLGRKVRHVANGDTLVAAKAEGGNWRALIELLAVLPQYWHVILSIGMSAIAAITLIWRHR